MFEIKMAELLIAAEHLAAMDQTLALCEQSGLSKSGAWNVQTLGQLLKASERVLKVAEDADLDATAASAGRLRQFIERIRDTHTKSGNLQGTDHQIEELHRYVQGTRTVLSDQMAARFVLLLSAEDGRLYEPKAPVFGANFAQKFAGAAYDLAEACRCRALDRNTAAAFHLMRVTEHGIRAMRACLAIPQPLEGNERNWGMMLNRIREANGARGKWSEADYFKELYVLLDGVKDAWRNAGLHTERRYDAADARRIHDALRGLMERVADRMDENGQPLAKP